MLKHCQDEVRVDTCRLDSADCAHQLVPFNMTTMVDAGATPSKVGMLDAQEPIPRSSDAEASANTATSGSPGIKRRVMAEIVVAVAAIGDSRNGYYGEPG